MQEIPDISIMLLLSFAFFGCVWLDCRRKQPPGMLTWFMAGVVFSYVFPYAVLKLSGQGFYYSPESPFESSAGFFILAVACLLVYAGAQTAKAVFGDKSPPCPPRQKSAAPRRVVAGFIAAYALIVGAVSVWALLKTRAALTNADALRASVYSKIQLFTLDGALALLPLCLPVLFANRYARTRKKRYFALLTAGFIVALPVAFVTGERTNVILTILLPAAEFCRCRKKIRYAAVPVLAAVLFTALFSLLFKGAYTAGSTMLCGVLKTDVDMNWTLWAAADNAGLFVNKMAPFNGFGYLNTLMAFLPRSLFPFKGLSSGEWFTAFWQHRTFSVTAGYPVSFLNWGFKFGWVTELILNFGFFGIAFSFFYGFVIGLFDRIAQSRGLTYPFLAYLCFSVSFLTSFTIVSLMTIPILAAVYLSGLTRQKNFH